MLHHVVHHRIGKATVAACISQWKREDMERNMSDAEQEAILATFRLNIDQLQTKKEHQEKKSRKRVAAMLDDTPAASQQTSDASMTAAVMPIVIIPSHASVPAFLPFLLDGFGRYLSQHPEALCPVDLPLVISPPQRRGSTSRLMQQPEASMPSTVAAAPSSDARHPGLDAVAQAAAFYMEPIHDHRDDDAIAPRSRQALRLLTHAETHPTQGVSPSSVSCVFRSQTMWRLLLWRTSPPKSRKALWRKRAR